MSGELPGSCGVPILGLLLGIGATACSPAERPGAPTESLAPAELREDLDFLFRTLEKVHPDMYAYASREAVAAERERLYRRIDDPMTALGLYKLLVPFVASLGSAHTSIHFPGMDDHLQKGGKLHPIEVVLSGTEWILSGYYGPGEVPEWILSGYYGPGEVPEWILSGYYGPGEVPLGSRITSLDGEEPEKAFARLALYATAEARVCNPWELERPSVLQAALWMEYGEEDLRLELQLPDGEARQVMIPSLEGRRFNTKAIMDYERRVFSYRLLGECGTGVLQVDSVSLGYAKDFRRFLHETFGVLRDEGATRLIVDLRENSGGARESVMEVLGYLTDERVALQEGEPRWLQALGANAEPGLRFRGDLYVLIGRRTASAAMGLAAAVRHYHLGTLLGEETADRMVFFGEGRSVDLPHSGLRLTVASDRTAVIGARAGEGVVPDHEVRQDPKDVPLGRDTVLEFTIALIGRDGRNGGNP